MTDRPSRRAIIAGTLGGAALAATQFVAGADAEDEPNGLRVMADLVAKPEHADDLRSLLVPFAAGARKEPGCLHYKVLEVEGEPGHFITYEIWTDRAALDAHMKTPAMAAAAPKLVPILAKPFTQTFLDVVS
jgi:quinol monooxygenase YgiN